MVNFKENYHFSRFRRGSNIFQVGGGGGSNFFQGGGGGCNCLFPIETHITCDFPGGGGGPDTLSPTLGPHLFKYGISSESTPFVMVKTIFGDIKTSYEKFIMDNPILIVSICMGKSISL